MTMALKLLCRVVRNRVAHGEDLEAVLDTYAKLTEDERKLVADAL